MTKRDDSPPVGRSVAAGMLVPSDGPLGTGDVGADVVVAYLRAHPDFFATHGDLLRHLEAPKRHFVRGSGGGVVDFQQYMVDRLQRDLDRMSCERTDMIATARDNQQSQARIHASALALLEARDLGMLVAAITTDFAMLLDLDVVTLVVESNGTAIPQVHGSGVRVVSPGTIERWLEGRRAVLRDHVEADPAIFGEAVGLVRSEALLRLEISRIAPVGLLAFGSRDPRMFQPGQATELVGFLARVVELRLRAELDLPSV